MKKYLALVFFAALFMVGTANAQYRRYGGRMRRYPSNQGRVYAPPYTPSASISIGYGWPNLDKDQLYQFYNFAQGPASQNGVLHGSFDYQYSRTASIGVAVTHGK